MSWTAVTSISSGWRLEDAGAFFVTRAKSNLKAQRRYSRPVDRTSGLICDQIGAIFPTL